MPTGQRKAFPFLAVSAIRTDCPPCKTGRVRHLVDYSQTTEEWLTSYVRGGAWGGLGGGQVGEEALEKGDGTANIGIMYFKAGEHTLEFVTEWKRMIDKRPDYWDQNAFNGARRCASLGAHYS